MKNVLSFFYVFANCISFSTLQSFTALYFISLQTTLYVSNNVDQHTVSTIARKLQNVTSFMMTVS